MLRGAPGELPDHGAENRYKEHEAPDPGFIRYLQKIVFDDTTLAAIKGGWAGTTKAVSAWLTQRAVDAGLQRI